MDSTTSNVYADDAGALLFFNVLKYLWHWECPECGECGRHDGDCTRDSFYPGRGLFGNAPPFRGTSLTGLLQLSMAFGSRAG